MVSVCGRRIKKDVESRLSSNENRCPFPENLVLFVTCCSVKLVTDGWCPGYKYTVYRPITDTYDIKRCLSRKPTKGKNLRKQWRMKCTGMEKLSTLMLMYSYYWRKSEGSNWSFWNRVFTLKITSRNDMHVFWTIRVDMHLLQLQAMNFNELEHRVNFNLYCLKSLESKFRILGLWRFYWFFFYFQFLYLCTKTQIKFVTSR